jgi:hypothetical protein
VGLSEVPASGVLGVVVALAQGRELRITHHVTWERHG